MESTSNKAITFSYFLYLFPFKLFHNMISSYGSTLWPSLLSFFVRDSEVQVERKDWRYSEDMGDKKMARFEEENKEDDGWSLLGKDINMVMNSLGIEKHGFLEGKDVQKRWGCDEICEVLDEEDVRLEEVREAFNVFDQDKDGFIDGRELQRVLITLGLNQGVDVNACKKMIRVFDDNGDGKIDFHEFLRLLS